jgi:two-component system NtrC family response regulator
VHSDKFRSDLFYRLSVFQITLPALRERKTDIGLIAQNFIQHFAAKVNKHITGATPEFFKKIEAYNWPGNVRELKNVIERSVILCDGNELDASLLPYEFEAVPQQSNNISAFDLSSIEKLHIQRVLNHTQGNRAEAARLLNIGVATLYRKLKEYGLE